VKDVSGQTAGGRPAAGWRRKALAAAGLASAVTALAIAAGCGAGSVGAVQDAGATTPPAKPQHDVAFSGGSSVPGASASARSGSATSTLSRGAATRTGRTYSATARDRSAVRVRGGAALTLKRCLILKTGGTSSLDDSSFYGLNAAVVAKTGSTARLKACTVKANASGANGVVATGAGARVFMTGGRVVVAGQGAHGVDATLGGAITAKDVRITTSGANAAALATDRGGGTIVVKGGSMTTSGADSPGIYSTGLFTIGGAAIKATGAEAAVIEGTNSITLDDTSLTTNVAGKWGVMIYQSMSGDAEGAEGTFAMTGGSLTSTASTGPLFYVTDSTGVITLTGVKVTAGSGTLVQAAAGRWGTSGSNGGHAELAASGQTLSGDLVADGISSLVLSLTDGSTLTGAIDAAGVAKSANLALDASSTWTVTADSHLTALSDDAGISGTTVTNIVGNGHTVIYDAAANATLGGKTFSLHGGGTLEPAS